MDARAVDGVHIADEVPDADAPAPRVQLGNDDEVALDVDCRQHRRARRCANAVEVLPEQVQEAEALQRSCGVVQLLYQDAGRRWGGGSGCGESAEEETPHFFSFSFLVGGGGRWSGALAQMR